MLILRKVFAFLNFFLYICPKYYVIMKCAEYRIAKNFKEAIKDKNSLFEIFILSENGYSVKRRLMKVEYRYEYDYRYIRISICDKFGRLMDSYSVYVEKGNDYGNDVNNNALTQYGVIYTTSRDYAYNHCMSVLKSKMADLRSKANKLHESIYTL